MRALRYFRIGLSISIAAAGLALLLGGSTSLMQDRRDQVRRHTRALEFDYVSWTMRALGVKLSHFVLGAPGYLSELNREQLVRNYLTLVGEAGRLQGELEGALADPTVANPQLAARPLMDELEQRREQLATLQPLAEVVLQEDTAEVLAGWGLGIGGSSWPPVSFRFSRLPVALIVSPRETIQQDANVQLEASLSLEDQIALESKVEQGLDVSALVVSIGGLSTYPTMIAETPALDWLAETIAHEWVHHYLAFRPLGLGYSATPEMRIINETVAGIVGREIGLEMLRRYFPDKVPPLPPEPADVSEPAAVEPPEPPAFDFRAEMRETRVEAEALLAQGRIEKAESYMERRRVVFWDNGYRHIRRINQAYFSFYGAYAESPRGEAGEDPVGTAVRALWEQIGDPVEFLRATAWVTSYEDLLELLES